MQLHEFIHARRDEIIEACRARLREGGGPQRLSAHLPEFLAETARVLEQDTTVPELALAVGGSASVQERPVPFIGAAARAVELCVKRLQLTLSRAEQEPISRALDLAIASIAETYWERGQPQLKPRKADNGHRPVDELRRTLKSVNSAFELVRASEQGIDGRTAELLAKKLLRLEALVQQCLGTGEEQANVPASSASPAVPARRDSEAPQSGDRSVRSVESPLNPVSCVLLGDTPSMTRIRTCVDQLSRRSRAPVMVLGEFGTGKRHCARALHAATYPEGEFFELEDAEHFPELESRLASLRARSSAQAAAGLTVYVHELAQAPASVQLRLSKLLQEQSLQFRVVASSSRGLPQACKEGLLRSELVFRFPSELELPPLRDRASDIAELVRHFSVLAAERSGTPATEFSPGALERLKEHQWPGNLTELSTFVERMTQEVGAGLVDVADIPDLGDRPSGIVFNLPPTGIDFAELERELLMQALAMARNNQTRAASLLGLTRDQIRYRLSKFEIMTGAARSS